MGDYDIAIIGLGPAGSTVARLLSSKYKIIAIDKKSTKISNSFQKPCGGLLAPDAQKALAKFKLTLPNSILVNPQIFMVKTMDLQRSITRYYQRFYLNIDRHKFDVWLMSLIPRNIEIRENAACIGIQRENDYYKISFLQNQKEESVNAKYVIGADGSNSIIRRMLFPTKKIKQYISIQEWFMKKQQVPFYFCLFDKTITDSYCWGVSKDEYFIIGGAFERKKCREKFALLKEEVQKEGFILGESMKRETCLISMPRKILDLYTGKDNIFLIGEAAGFVSPSSLEGISYALNSGEKLAEILNLECKKPNHKFRKATRFIKMKLLFKKMKAFFMYNPLLRKWIMKTKINSISVKDD